MDIQIEAIVSFASARENNEAKQTDSLTQTKNGDLRTWIFDLLCH